MNNQSVALYLVAVCFNQESEFVADTNRFRINRWQISGITVEMVNTLDR